MFSHFKQSCSSLKPGHVVRRGLCSADLILNPCIRVTNTLAVTGTRWRRRAVCSLNNNLISLHKSVSRKVKMRRLIWVCSKYWGVRAWVQAHSLNIFYYVGINFLQLVESVLFSWVEYLLIIKKRDWCLPSVTLFLNSLLAAGQMQWMSSFTFSIVVAGNKFLLYTN